MLLRTVAILGFAFGLVVLWMGCNGDRAGDSMCVKSPADVPKDELGRDGEGCIRDADCRTGFCNRTTCVEPREGIGSLCDVPAPDAGPIDKLPEHLCAGSVCLDGRCRSCKEDAECQSYFGMGKCIQYGTGVYPSGRCEPWTTRRPAGSACDKDAECEGLFCDRGSCAKIAELGHWNYGEACVPGPPHAPADNLDIVPPRERCEGYLCVDGRCRSCKEDAECQKGSSGLTCVPIGDWAGKVCVTPSQAERYPQQILVPHGAPTIKM
jgi:hypothetical protein